MQAGIHGKINIGDVATNHIDSSAILERNWQSNSCKALVGDNKGDRLEGLYHRSIEDTYLGDRTSDVQPVALLLLRHRDTQAIQQSTSTILVVCSHILGNTSSSMRLTGSKYCYDIIQLRYILTDYVMLGT